MVTLSACMIVKNEEDMLHKCLSSIAPVVDEIVLVDTGSTDRTMEIADQYGARIFEHPWQNDFSLHRNQSIRYAEGDWLLIIDADEILGELQISPKEFKARFAMLPREIGALVCVVHEDMPPKMSWIGSRFLRNTADLHYEGIVHNQPRFKGSAAGCDVEIFHFGYSLSPEKMQAKRVRTMALLNERLEKDHRDHNAMFYRSLTRMGGGELHAGIEDAIRCLDMLEDKGITKDKMSCYGQIYNTLGVAFLKLRDPGMAWSWLSKGLEFFPDDIDLNYTMALLGWQCKRDDIMLESARHYLDLMEKRRKDQKVGLGNFANYVPEVPITARHLHAGTPEVEARVKGWIAKIEPQAIEQEQAT